MDLKVSDLRRLVADLSVCPHPQKLRFVDETAAQQHADPIGLDVYLCVCGNWHMTSGGRAYAYPPCPICGAPCDDEGWDDCGCYFDLMFGDRD